MSRKASILLISFFIFQLIVSCCKDVEFIDFTEITFKSDQTLLIQGDTLSFEIWADDLKYLGATLNDFGFSKTMAFSCVEGLDGMKFPVQTVQITSNNDFDPTHLAGTSLNDLFFEKSYNEVSSEQELLPLKAEGFMNQGIADLLLLSSPQLEQRHTFTLTFEKSNGEVVTGTTEEIKWE